MKISVKNTDIWNHFWWCLKTQLKGLNGTVNQFRPNLRWPYWDVSDFRMSSWTCRKCIWNHSIATVHMNWLLVVSNTMTHKVHFSSHQYNLLISLCVTHLSLPYYFIITLITYHFNPLIFFLGLHPGILIITIRDNDTSLNIHCTYFCLYKYLVDIFFSLLNNAKVNSADLHISEVAKSITHDWNRTIFSSKLPVQFCYVTFT